MKIPTVAKLLEDQLKDIYNAENQLVKALPKMARKASSEGLKDAITSHLQETRHQVERLDEIGQIMSLKLTGKKCKAMEGLVEEGAEVLEAEGPGPVIDAALIAAAQRVEHYEISAYGSRAHWRNIWVTRTWSDSFRKRSRKNRRPMRS